MVGVVAKALGLAGETFVRPDPDLDEPFPPGAAYASSRGGELVIASSRLHSGRQVVRFDGVDSREAAEALRGAELRRPRADIPLDDDAFWTDELIGREVLDDSGAVVGVVEAVADGAAHDYLVVARPDGGEVLLPAVAELVEVGADHVVVHAIPGLLDDQPG
ncbi:MAG: ribosome maturation factor RimM [Actinomycetota bacterium]|nr:16S rRNA processing protein RimM [Euzebyaceae bacterium]MDQ3452152.1 ribosome maturation factor RimM [Actinomycetota bacterium]